MEDETKLKKDKAGPARQTEEDIFQNKEPAGNDFMIWEPQSFKHKILALLQNWIEAFCLVGFALTCLLSPSFVAIVLFIFSMSLMYTMTMKIKVRFIFGFYAMVACMVLVLLVSGLKAYWLQGFKETQTTRKLFR
jgi:hypothetical protein